ncbi:uncharacterized protein EV154DRAFT_586403, partial [Mucor mucedo]|uniref:uncharacterized protein n=1 Tax=Mucor mucedo TaxID=29922 RepID=UPI00221F8FD5
QSRLPKDARDWIATHVDNNMDWKAIKPLLRLSHEQMDNIEKNDNFPGVPMSMLVNHRAVQNVIYDRLQKKYKKNESDKISVDLWMDYLRSNDYQTFLDVDQEGGRIMVAWVSPYQKEFLASSYEWCLDSTYKTCKSFLHGDKYCYFFTIVVRNATTNKGIPAAFLITSDE